MPESATPEGEELSGVGCWDAAAGRSPDCAARRACARKRLACAKAEVRWLGCDGPRWRGAALPESAADARRWEWGIGWSTGGGGLRSKASVGTKREMEVWGCLTARALFAALPESVPQVRMKRWDEVCASRGRRRSGWCAYARKAPGGGLWGKGEGITLRCTGTAPVQQRPGAVCLRSKALPRAAALIVYEFKRTQRLVSG